MPNTEQSNTDKHEKHVIDQTPRGANGVAGRIEMSEDVVATIAGLAARDIDGVHALGRSRLISFGNSPSRGVDAEVGKKEAALDIEIIVDYGCDIRKVAKEVRHRIAEEVLQMAGRTVVEVNLDVVGIHVENREENRAERPRVQ